MKNYFDSFYEIIHKNSVKRRRMVSLLLVLSVFVSSGVLWELRDTVITMVNEPLCGLGEHEHTDECYEYRLICGLEENEEHTHTEECYEKVLICGYDEHIHDLSCYGIDNEFIDEKVDDELFALSGSFEDIDGEDDEELFVNNLPSLTLNNEYTILSKHNETAAPGTIETIDNIAEGIKFTMFDYGNSILESQNNHYGYRWVDPVKNSETGETITEGYWSHPNANTTDGINTARDAQQDILFLAYGTPVDRLCHNPDVYNYRDESGKTTSYKPDKNSYSGDYNATPQYSGNRPVTGIVDNTLTDGYPTINASEHHSLAYLFNESELTDSTGETYKTVYTDVNHLLKKVGGHLIYDSDENYAYYNQDTHDFTVYDNTYHIINEDHHFEGDVNNLIIENEQPITYDSDNGYEMQIGFFPFDQYDWTRRDPNYNGNGFNHHFGMKMEAEFINPDRQNITDPIIFSYSGDDDMWVFVDGRLVLDIGGIHEPTAGMIDFTNGLVWVQDDEEGDSASELSVYADDSIYPKPMNYYKTVDNKIVDNSHKWKVTLISEYFKTDEDPDGSHWNDTTDHKHDIKMFYLERGGCYSNLAMDMNLPTLKPLTVQKNVDYQQHLVKDSLIDDKEYEFQVWEWDSTNEVWVIPQSSDSTQPFYLPDNHFFLKDGRRKVFENLGQNRQFKIVEVGIDPNIYDQVSVNFGTPIQLNRGGGKVDISSSESPVPLSTTNSYTFNNRVIEDPPTNITVKKDWVDPDNKKPANFTMKYRIMRTDSLTGEVKQVALKDPDTGKKTRTFLLPPDKHVNGETISGLLSRYGNHIYTYKVEELNVPMGFNASYSETTDGSGNKILQVTNTDISNVDIYVKKEWENAPDPNPTVKLILKREKVGYSNSTPTDLKVKIVDEGGNLIKEKTITGLYANGSAEIECTLPNGVVCYRGDTDYLPAIQSSPSQLFAKYEDDENILIVRDLAAKTGDSIANEVTIKVTSGNAEDSLLLLHHSFTRGPNGWEANGPVTVETSGNDPYAKGDALLVKNRNKSWHGAKLALDPAKFKANKTYTFSAYLWSPVATRFKMTFNNGLDEFIQISKPPVSVNAETWTQVTGTIKLSENIDPYNMYIVVETIPYGDDYDNAPIEDGGIYFRMDEFTAIEGITSVSVSPQTMEGNAITDPGGIITIGEAASSDRVVYYYDFTNVNNSTGLGDGWILNDNPRQEGAPNGRTLGTGPPEGGDATNNFHFVRIWNRDHTDDAIKRQNVSFLQPGHTYRFEVQAQHVPGDGNAGYGAEDVHLTLNVNGSGINGNHFPWVCTVNIPDQENDHYKVYQNTGNEITIPADANINEMFMYFGTDPKNSNKYGPFRIWHITVTEVGNGNSLSGFTEPKDGYTINEHGQYVSNYSNYDIDLDINSVTNPLHLNGTYVTDDWSKEIILSTDGTLYADKNGAKWGYRWNKSTLGEDNGYLYRYWVEEALIGNDNVTTNIRVAGDDKIVESSHDDYIISYDRQFVATNTEDSPILVKNKYIWYKLPATGGHGTKRIYFLGSLLTAIGIISGSALYRRKRRRV